jgi:hypothetical protein
MHKKQFYTMTKFLCNTELYETVLQKSQETKEILWVSSQSLSLGAHRIFSQEILKNPPADIRFIFPINDLSINKGEVNPYELQYLMERFKGINIKSHENFHSNIYIFDNSVLITSATLTDAAFETSTEAGVLLEGSDLDEVKNFFTQNLWDSSKSMGDLKKYKLMWNSSQKTTKPGNMKKIKPHTKIRDWTNDYIDTWYIGVSKWLSKKSEHKIKKETNWPTDLSVLGDISYHAFTQVKLGDFVYIADLSKRGKIEIGLAKISDKARVETDEGDFHCAFETEKKYSLEREPFFEMLKNASIKSKTSEIILNDEQAKQIAEILFSIKKKRKRKFNKKLVKKDT